MSKRGLEGVEIGNIDNTQPSKVFMKTAPALRSTNYEESYETDPDGTKMIIRKFNIPLPPSRSVIQPTILRSPLSFCAPKEKWKYQHDVPDGKFITKKVFTTPNSQSAPSAGAKPEISVVSNSQAPLVFKRNYINPVRQDPQNKSILVVTSKEQSARGSENLNTEKIRVNNLPENVIPNSLTVVDSKIVNGRKFYYLKAFKEVGKVVSKSTESELSSASSKSSVEQNNNDTRVVKTVERDGVVVNTCGNANLLHATSVLTVPSPLESSVEENRVPVVTKTYPGRNSGVIPLSSVISGEQKNVVTVMSPTQTNVEVRNVDSLLGKPISVVNSDIISQLSMMSHDKAVPAAITLPCDKSQRQNEMHTKAPPLVMATGVIPLSNIRKYLKTVPTAHVVSQTSEPIKCGVVRPLSIMSSEINPQAKVAHDVTSNGREITLQLANTTSKVFPILNSDITDNNRVKENNESGVHSESTSTITEEAALPVKRSVGIDKTINQDSLLKSVPADSTTPFIASPVGFMGSMNYENNVISSESRMTLSNKEKVNPIDDMVNLIKEQNKISGSQNVLKVNSLHNSVGENITIVDAYQNKPGPLDSGTVLIPKQNIKYDYLMRRRRIALQYQRDVQKNRELPRIERRVIHPARQVDLVDTFTQTSLFCLLEPGRMVEMIVKEDLNGENIVTASRSNSSGTNFEQTESTINSHSGSSILDDTMQLSSSEITSKEIMDTSPAKRMRLDVSSSTSVAVRERYIDSATQNSLLATNKNTQDVEMSDFRCLEKENFSELNNKKTSFKSKRNTEQNIWNTDNSAPLTCMQSAMNSSANVNEINVMIGGSSQPQNGTKFDRKMMQQLYKDYRESLIPDEDGNLPIHTAVMDKNLRQVQRQCLVLTAQKHSVDVKNHMKETPLHLAVLCNDLKIVMLLLKFNAKPDTQDGEGNTALHMAIKWCSDNNILDTLLASVNDNNPVLNLPNDEGYSPLHLCALLNKGYEALLLLKKNADINIRDRKSGRTPLFHAVESENVEMSRMLVNSGASTTVPNFSGQTSLSASEVTLVLDKIFDPSAKVAAPCPCQTNIVIDNVQSIPNGQIHADEQRIVIGDICSIDVSDETNLTYNLLSCSYEQTHHSR